MARTDASQVDDRIMLALNSDTVATNYATCRASARASSHETAQTADNEAGVLPAATAGANVFGCGALAIPQHASTDRHKHILSSIGASGGRLGLYGARWKNTAAVTSLTFRPKSGTMFVQGSVFELSFAS